MSEPIKSFAGIEVGQLVNFTDDLYPDRNGTYRVAFIDPPEAILKPVEGDGWPRIAWMTKDFRAESYRITLVPVSENPE